MVEVSAATLTVSVVLPSSKRRSSVVGVFTSNWTSVRVSLRETRHFDDDFVSARRDLEELIFAARVGDDRAVEAGAGVAQGYIGACDHRALWIGDRAAKKGGGLRKAVKRSSRSQETDKLRADTSHVS